jgi:hypothetical protein
LAGEGGKAKERERKTGRAAEKYNFDILERTNSEIGPTTCPSTTDWGKNDRVRKRLEK